MALDGRVAIVTGCGKKRGIGRAISLALASAGADVAVTDVDPHGRLDSGRIREDDFSGDAWRGLESLVAEIEGMGRRAVGLLGDVSVEADADRLVREAIDQLGEVDILVNNAAAPHGEDRDAFWNVPTEAFDNVMGINVRGVFLMSRAVARHLISRSSTGAIVNIASVGGKRGFPRRVAYCASKFAVIGATQSMALDLAPFGVRVNAVCPDQISTDRLSDTHAKVAAGVDTSAATTTPLGRLGGPAEVADAVAFLVSPQAEFITGQALSIDGGSTMG
jgi:NAD(P)-dependent dehydrogenase (short-subunit alcohol dehydrogenase family)